MIELNYLEKILPVQSVAIKTFLKLLSPFAPHLTEELWSKLGEKKSIHLAPWPRLIRSASSPAATVKIVVQINGRTRDILETVPDLAEETIKKLALELAKIKRSEERRVGKECRSR